VNIFASISVTNYRYQTRYHSRIAKAVASCDAEFVFGKFCDLLIADGIIRRPDFSVESPWKRLRLHADGSVCERSAIGDRDRLSGLR
jgi:hypothetical protein